MFPTLATEAAHVCHRLKNGYTRYGDSGMLAGSEKAGRADPCYKREGEAGVQSPPPAVRVRPHELCVQRRKIQSRTESRFVGARVWGAKGGVPAEGDGVSVWGDGKFWK